MTNYAKQILDRMSAEDRLDFARQHGGAAFVQLWQDAHKGGDVPPIPSGIPLGEKIMRRADWDALPLAQQGAFMRSGGRLTH